jgi:hypothetical protein
LPMTIREAVSCGNNERKSYEAASLGRLAALIRIAQLNV